MDDVILSDNDGVGIRDLKCYLMHTFRMKDLGLLTYFLGLEIISTNIGIHIHQKKYAEDLLSLSRLSNIKIIDSPVELNVKFRKDAGNSLSDPTMYRHLLVV